MDCFSIIAPEGPVVMVHKGWKAAQGIESMDPAATPPQKTVAPPKKPTKPPSKTQFEFIQESKPTRYRDPIIAKQVRSHVRKEAVRNAKVASGRQQEMREKKDKPSLLIKRAKTEIEGPSSSESPSPPPISPTLLFDHPTALVLYQYPIEMSPHMHALLGHYLKYANNQMFPLKSLASNPLELSGWFRYAVTDEAILHSMLYAASVYLSLGGGDSKDVIYHQNETISILQKRMMNPYAKIKESTIGAISCLALGEAVSGNIDRWRVHMYAIKQMVQDNGQFTSLSRLMQRKLCRSDVSGAIDYVAVPILDFEGSPPPYHIWDILPTEQLAGIRINATYLLKETGIKDALLETMIDFAYFTQTINLAQSSLAIHLDPTTFAEDLYWIEYQLLSFPKTLQKGEEEDPIDKVCRLGGLLLMKGIMQEFPHSKNGSSVLFSEVQASLNAVPITKSFLPLHFWVSVVGGILSNGEVKSWFTVYLAFIAQEFGISSLECEAVRLNRILGLWNVFGPSIDRLWGDVLSLQNATNEVGLINLSV